MHNQGYLAQVSIYLFAFDFRNAFSDFFWFNLTSLSVHLRPAYLASKTLFSKFSRFSKYFYNIGLP